MGLISGSGMFIDDNRIALSQFKNYANLIINNEIRDSIKTIRLILVTLIILIKFIHCVLIHEQEKHIVILLNKHGEYLNKILPYLI